VLVRRRAVLVLPAQDAGIPDAATDTEGLDDWVFGWLGAPDSSRVSLASRLVASIVHTAHALQLEPASA
jgi:hypothetical protein